LLGMTGAVEFADSTAEVVKKDDTQWWGWVLSNVEGNEPFLGGLKRFTFRNIRKRNKRRPATSPPPKTPAGPKGLAQAVEENTHV